MNRDSERTTHEYEAVDWFTSFGRDNASGGPCDSACRLALAYSLLQFILQ